MTEKENLYKEIRHLRTIVNSMHDTVINKLKQFELLACRNVFFTMFPEKAQHLWEKYEKCNKNVIKFYFNLDSKNQDYFILYLKNKMN